MKTLDRSAHRTGAALLFSLLASAAAAQNAAEHPAAGPYLIAAIGSSEYISEPGFVTCRCRKDSTTAVKLGGGYRFGVSAVEAWWVDFGSANFGSDSFGPASSAHVKGLVLGGAWSGRFGRYFELTGRLGAAYLEFAADGQATARHWRPALGGAVGWRVTDATTVELSLDATNMRDSEGTSTNVHALGLGLRYRF